MGAVFEPTVLGAGSKGNRKETHHFRGALQRTPMYPEHTSREDLCELVYCKGTCPFAWLGLMCTLPRRMSTHMGFVIKLPLRGHCGS